MTDDDTMRTRLDSLHAEVSTLSDLFRRRLLEDRKQRQVIDILQARAQAAEAGLGAQYVVPIVMQLVRLADRAELHNTGHDEFVASLADEIRVILDNCGVEHIGSTGVPVDRLAHEIRSVYGTPPGTLRVATVIRPGCRYFGKVLRPAIVDAEYRIDQIPPDSAESPSPAPPVPDEPG